MDWENQWVNTLGEMILDREQVSWLRNKNWYSLINETTTENLKWAGTKITRNTIQLNNYNSYSKWNMRKTGEQCHKQLKTRTKTQTAARIGEPSEQNAICECFLRHRSVPRWHVDEWKHIFTPGGWNIGYYISLHFFPCTAWVFPTTSATNRSKLECWLEGRARSVIRGESKFNSIQPLFTKVNLINKYEWMRNKTRNK